MKAYLKLIDSMWSVNHLTSDRLPQLQDVVSTQSFKDINVSQ